MIQRPPGLGAFPILVVEQICEPGSPIARHLKRRGYTYKMVGTAIQALHELCSSDFSLILLDPSLETMDGFEITKIFRAFEKREGMARSPIIALLGEDKAEDIAACEQAGMDDHLLKPIDPELLDEKIRDLLVLDAA